MAMSDVLYIAVFLFSLAIVLPVIYGLYNKISPRVQTLINDPTTTQILQTTGKYLGYLDMIFLFVFSGIILISLIFAAFLPASPLFFVANFIFMIISLLVMPSLANAYISYAQKLSVVDIELQFPYTFWIMNNLPIVMTVWGFAMLIIIAIRWGE